MSGKNKILIVDDEPDIIELLEYNLKKEGYEVYSAGNGQRAIELAREVLPDLILLDIMMPKMDGVEACRKIREVQKLKETYIIFLTARSEEFSEIAAFDAGADDFITKPIKPRALMSRISAYFRRDIKKETPRAIVSIGNLIIDKSSYTVTHNEVKIILPKKEFELLFFLSQNPETVFTRDDLLKNIWGTDVYVVPRTVDVHIRKIREKIGEDYITTVKGIGYKFVLV